MEALELAEVAEAGGPDPLHWSPQRRDTDPALRLSAEPKHPLHMISLDGAYLPVENAAPVFRHVPAPTGTQLQELSETATVRKTDWGCRLLTVTCCGPSPVVRMNCAPISPPVSGAK